MEVYLKAEYAKTSRASCTACKQKIAKETFRVGVVEDQEGRFHSERFYHVNCLPQLPPKLLKKEKKDIESFEKLKEADQNQLWEIIEAQQKNIPKDEEQNGNEIKVEDAQQQKAQKNKPPPSKPPAQKKKVKLSEDKELSVSSGFKKRGRPRLDKWTDLPSSEEQEDQFKDQLLKDMNESESFEDDDDGDDDDTKELDLAGYNEQENKRYRELQLDLEKRNVPTLKEMLKKNDQNTSGNKDELIARIADGMILGQIPYCPECKKGKLKFNNMTGKYRCPGYMDENEFKHCNKTFNRGEVVRPEWKPL